MIICHREMVEVTLVVLAFLFVTKTSTRLLCLSTRVLLS